MVTREEYNKALDICLQYEKQIAREVKGIHITKNRLLFDMYENKEISGRLWNNVCKQLHHYLDCIDENNYKKYTLLDLFKLTDNEILRLQNCGGWVLEEVQNLKEKYCEVIVSNNKIEDDEEEEESGTIDFNKRELIKLHTIRNVLYNALQMLENGEDPKAACKLQLDECQKEIKILDEIIKEPLFILEEKEVAEDISKLFLIGVKRLGLEENLLETIQKQIDKGNFLTYNDTLNHFKYRNYLSYLLLRNDREKDIELWKQVAVENAKINNTPYEVANETLKALDKQLDFSSRYTKKRF